MTPPLIDQVHQIYKEIESSLRTSPDLAGKCNCCGKCCNFKSFDHLLYVTGPEIEYLAHHIGAENIKGVPQTRNFAFGGQKPMSDGICPYNEKGKCTVYDYRFSGCRIFCCQGDKDFQSQLTESTLTDLKQLCLKFEMPYSYRQLSEVLT